MKHKILMLIISTFFAFSGVGCGAVSEENENISQTAENASSEYENDTPQKTVDDFLKCYKANEFDNMKNYLLDENNYFESIAENLAIMLSDMTENFEYEIIDCKFESDETSLVTVDMKNIKMSEVAMDTLADYSSSEIARKKDATNEEISAELLKILDEKVEFYKKDGKIGKTVAINLYKQEGQEWKIINDADMFDGMTGNCMSFISRNLKNFVAENGQVDTYEN